MRPSFCPTSFLVALVPLGAVIAQTPLGADFDERIRPILVDGCFDCHSGAEPKAGVDLDGLAELDPLVRFELLRRVRDRVHAREMPPLDWGELDEAEVVALSDWAHERVVWFARATLPAPHRVTLRRLSRVEYDNTVRDLFGVTTEMSAAFPATDLGHGFDNIGDATTSSILHVEKYAAAAADVARQVVPDDRPGEPVTHRIEVEQLAGENGTSDVGEFANFFTRATLVHTVALPRAGTYRVAVRACGDQAGDEPCRVELSIGGREIARFDVAEPRGSAAVRDVSVALGGGAQTVSVTFLNDYYRPEAEDPAQRDRNLLVDWIEITGPLDAAPVPDAAAWLWALDRGRGRPQIRAAPMMRELLRRAFRRTPKRDEVARFAGVVADAVTAGDSFHAGVRIALEAVLLSPSFLFRVERSLASPRASSRELGSHELATRLSFFLWSTTPDRRLDALADQARLREPSVLAAEAKRMLGDPRSRALAENFAAQWLELRNLDAITPDPERFGVVSDALRRSMRTESELLFDAVLRDGRSVTELLTADFTHVDALLARHYGIDAPSGDGFVRVPAPLGRRAGVLGHASVHAVTANSTRTSAVKRGKWILENLLDAPPPAPPPGSDSLEGDVPGAAAATLRKQLELHRSKPACAVCHARMDPLGFALEQFDPIGRRRESDGGEVVDARVDLPGGRVLDGAESLAAFIAADPAFVRGLLRKLFVYAIGRDASVYDSCELEALAASLSPAPTLAEMIVGVVGLQAFRTVQTDGAAEGR